MGRDMKHESEQHPERGRSLNRRVFTAQDAGIVIAEQNRIVAMIDARKEELFRLVRVSDADSPDHTAHIMVLKELTLLRRKIKEG